MLGLNDTSTCTCPANTTAIVKGSEFNLLIENSCMHVMAVFYLYNVSGDANVLSVLTDDVVPIRKTSFVIISGPGTPLHVVLSDSRFCACCKSQTF